MARGIRKNEEIDAMEIEPVASNAAPVSANAAPVKVIGNMKARPAELDKNVGGKDRFVRIKASRDGWIKMTVEEAIAYQEQGVLIGHDIHEGIGLIQ